LIARNDSDEEEYDHLFRDCRCAAKTADGKPLCSKFAAAPYMDYQQLLISGYAPLFATEKLERDKVSGRLRTEFHGLNQICVTGPCE